MDWLFCKIEDFSAEEYDRAYGQLSPSRKARVDRFRQPADRIRSLAGELLTQKLLKERYGVFDSVLHSGPEGQPMLSGCDLKVSIAHCDELAVCAVSPHPVGIDAERLRPIDLSAARLVCVEEELAYLLEGAPLPKQGSRCEDPAVLRRFFEIWTAKEAYFKKCGTGITDLRSVNVLPLPRQLFTVEDYLIQIME